MLNLKKARLHPGLSTEDLCFDGVPVRIYRPKAPSAGWRKGFVFFHGGAGMMGSIDYYQDVCSKLAKDSQTVLVSVGYRLSPEHPYPTQCEDCFAATVHFMKNSEVFGVDPSQIVIGGDSAGGNYASVIAQKLVERPDLPRLRAQVLLYAGTQAMDFNLPSYQQNATMPLLFQDSVVFYGLKYFGKSTSLTEDLLIGSHVPDEIRLKCDKWMRPENLPERFLRRGFRQIPAVPCKPEVYEKLPEILSISFSSLFADDAVIRQLPETFVVTCEYDVLRDDSLLYKKRLEDNGVKVSWFHSENGFHGVINCIDLWFLTFPAGVEILDRAADFVRSL
uniref:Alpha/beta hydrolase fold-3 domain-containing protein n=1 Tax=Anolis carolinensis TaxID=28377 RepID=H9GQA2_ANOCA|nr:PREDICTED: arylacetamide deacetylase-like 3 [Anolis carolinensis]|eukprot:XP_003229240.2 PREDICTED: arylacetamide deacetylase-like 3 [Anolis carolinensis]